MLSDREIENVFNTEIDIVAKEIYYQYQDKMIKNNLRIWNFPYP